MSPYLAIIKIRVLALLQYRGAAVAGIASQLFWAIMRIAILTAFFAQSTIEQPISLTQTITLIWLGQALLQLLPWNIDTEIEMQVKNGDVAYELTRPLHLYWLWFSRSIAMRIAPASLHYIPLFLIAGLFYGLSMPASLPSFLAFCTSLITALLLSAAITTCVITTLFWTTCGQGIQRILPHISLFLSGLVVPLPLFPTWCQQFLQLQPFRGIIDIPCRLYTGLIPPTEAPYYIAFQLLWALTFIWLGKRLLAKAMQRFVIQGG